MLSGCRAGRASKYTCAFSKTEMSIGGPRRAVVSEMCAFVLFWLCVPRSVSGQDGECPYKECYCGLDFIICNHNNLDSIPTDVGVENKFYNKLNLDNNRIRTIPKGSLPANLNMLTMQGNPIESIDNAAFEGSVNTLETLVLCGARFTQIPTAVFHLNNLNTLSICDTPIRVWNFDSMTKLGASLVTLDLDSVGFTEWPEWINSYSHLNELGISGGSISSIPDNAFDMMAETLTTLGLQNNSFTSVPKAIWKLTALHTLYLQENKITDLTWLPQNSKLSTLSLFNNRISNGSALSKALRVYAQSLTGVEIYSNLLAAIPELSFLHSVQSLDLTNNVISDIQSGSIPLGVTDVQLEYNLLYTIPRVMKTLTNVRNLNLNSNRITVISGTDYPPSTTFVDFGHNLLSEISKSCFPENSGITFLLLNDNPISHISMDAFSNLPHLSSINLQYSHLTRLPLAIASLNNLTQLDVSGSANLVCTCLENSLASKIQRMQLDSVIGDCGSTSVYVFFSKLSQGCPPFFDDFQS